MNNNNQFMNLLQKRQSILKITKNIEKIANTCYDLVILIPIWFLLLIPYGFFSIILINMTNNLYKKYLNYSEASLIKNINEKSISYAIPDEFAKVLEKLFIFSLRGKKFTYLSFDYYLNNEMKQSNISFNKLNEELTENIINNFFSEYREILTYYYVKIKKEKCYIVKVKRDSGNLGLLTPKYYFSTKKYEQGESIVVNNVYGNDKDILRVVSSTIVDYDIERKLTLGKENLGFYILGTYEEFCKPYTHDELKTILVNNETINWDKVDDSTLNFTFHYSFYKYTPISWAIQKNYSWETVKKMITKGADLRFDSAVYPLLELSILKNYTIEQIDYLLDHNANINEENEVGYNAFFNIAYDNNLECAKLLKNRGANIFVENKWGVNAIGNCLAGNFKIEFFEYLVNLGIDYKKVDIDNETIYNYSLKNPKAVKYKDIFLAAIQNKITKSEMLYQLRNFDTDNLLETNYDVKEIKKLVNNFLDSIDKYFTTSVSYPYSIEARIQEAVTSKRKAEYLEAVKIYLQLIEDRKIVYSAILYFMYKTLACAGVLVESIKILSLGKTIYDKDTNLVNSYIRSAFDDHFERFNVSVKNERLFYNYLKDISGNKDYVFNRPYEKMLKELDDYLRGDINNVDKRQNVSTNQSEIYYIIGVRFVGTNYGCYYYRCTNDKYNLNETVNVPTRNGTQIATVIFKKTYYDKNDLPVSLSILKWAPSK